MARAEENLGDHVQALPPKRAVARQSGWEQVARPLQEGLRNMSRQRRIGGRPPTDHAGSISLSLGKDRVVTEASHQHPRFREWRAGGTKAGDRSQGRNIFRSLLDWAEAWEMNAPSPFRRRAQSWTRPGWRNMSTTVCSCARRQARKPARSSAARYARTALRRGDD